MWLIAVPLAGYDVECADVCLCLRFSSLLLSTKGGLHCNNQAYNNKLKLKCRGPPNDLDDESSGDDFVDELLMGLASGVP